MNPVERFLQKGEDVAKYGFYCLINLDELDNKLLLFYFKHKYPFEPRLHNSVNFFSNIVYICLRLKDYKSALEWLGKWLDVEPENEEVQLLIKYLDYLVMELAREKRLGIVRSEKSSYFTKKNFLILGLAVCGFCYLKNIK